MNMVCFKPGVRQKNLIGSCAHGVVETYLNIFQTFGNASVAVTGLCRADCGAYQSDPRGAEMVEKFNGSETIGERRPDKPVTLKWVHIVRQQTRRTSGIPIELLADHARVLDHVREIAFGSGPNNIKQMVGLVLVFPLVKTLSHLRTDEVTNPVQSPDDPTFIWVGAHNFKDFIDTSFGLVCELMGTIDMANGRPADHEVGIEEPRDRPDPF
jgi:hypothetical protein